MIERRHSERQPASFRLRRLHGEVQLNREEEERKSLKKQYFQGISSLLSDNHTDIKEAGEYGITRIKAGEHATTPITVKVGNIEERLFVNGEFREGEESPYAVMVQGAILSASRRESATPEIEFRVSIADTDLPSVDDLTHALNAIALMKEAYAKEQKTLFDEKQEWAKLGEHIET